MKIWVKNDMRLQLKLGSIAVKSKGRIHLLRADVCKATTSVQAQAHLWSVRKNQAFPGHGCSILSWAHKAGWRHHIRGIPLVPAAWDGSSATGWKVGSGEAVSPSLPEEKDQIFCRTQTSPDGSSCPARLISRMPWDAPLQTSSITPCHACQPTSEVKIDTAK